MSNRYYTVIKLYIINSSLMPLDTILLFNLEIGMCLSASAFGILPMFGGAVLALVHIEQEVV